MCNLGGDHVSASQLDLGAVRNGEVCEAPAGDDTAREGAQGRRRPQAVPQDLGARAGIELAHDQALATLRLASPLGQGAALVRLVELQAALITDLRNRVASLEGREEIRRALGGFP